MSGPFVGQRPWSSIIGLLSEAGDLGLRVIVTARAAGSAHAVMTAPLLRRLNELQATTLMLSGNPADSGKFAASASAGCLLVGEFCWETATHQHICSW